MARRKPIVIDGERLEVDVTTTIADVVAQEVTSIATDHGLIPSEEFTRVPVPANFVCNLSAINKGGS